MRTCSIPECGRRHKGHGLCKMHLRRLRANGTTELPSIEDRFRTKYDIDQDTGCWVWRNIITGNQGYAYFSVNGAPRRAHRWAYQHFVSPVPDDLHLDHLCRNRACVNPDHLEPVTPRENMRRSPLLYKDACDAGHPYVAGSYYMDRGARLCKECKRQAVREYAARTNRNRATYICPTCGEVRSKPHRAKHMRICGTTTRARPEGGK